MRKGVDLTGKRFGRLIAIRKIKIFNKDAKWCCQCDCGATKDILTHSLTSGRTTSCGCYGREVYKTCAKTHGLSKTPEYRVWNDMLGRCNRPKNSKYHRYGGRGITVCDRWRDFVNFYADMGEKPTPKHTIDRIDNDGNYEPDNCRWSTRAVQARNTSLRKDSKTGFRGITMAGKNYRVAIRALKTIYLGTYATLEEAIQARKDGEKKYWHD